MVEFGTQWELDARDIPSDWPTGYLGVDTRHPNEKPALNYQTEIFKLNPALQTHAYELTKNVKLTESKASAAWRLKYPYAPANKPPVVTRCDSVTGNTWFSGTKLSERAEVWTKIVSDGQATYCMTQQEDNATYEGLLRASREGLLDVGRIAVIRAGSDFDRPAPGDSEVDNLLDYQKQDAFGPALTNLRLVGSVLVNNILQHWPKWQKGITP